VVELLEKVVPSPHPAICRLEPDDTEEMQEKERAKEEKITAEQAQDTQRRRWSTSVFLAPKSEQIKITEQRTEPSKGGRSTIDK